MGEGTRILGVDDSLTIRKALELVLKPAGYNLELAASGAEALEKAKEFKPEIMLLDFILPDMRGTEVCKLLSSDPETAQIPIVLISAKGAEIRQAYEDVGNVVSYVTKPFSPDDLTWVVAEIIAQAAEAAEAAPVEAPPAEVPPPAAAQPPVSEPAPPAAVMPPAPTPAFEPAAPLPHEAPPPVGEAWEEAEEAEEEVVPAQVAAERKEALEVMFESIRAGLEGVYVEEVDTTAGAAADEAKTYTDLVSRLGRQLGETLHQARSGLRFALSSDGSVRSLDENLFDAFRRFCRVLFRAATAGAVGQEASVSRARVLVVCRRESELFETLKRLTDQDGDWHGFMVCERFRQLPIMTRLYGPTHVIAEVSRPGALVDQLKTIRKLPEARRIKVIGVCRPDENPEPEMVTELGVQAMLRDGPELWGVLREQIMSRGGASARMSSPETAAQ